MIRFAIWVAVSTLEQVGGASLEHQQIECRKRGIGEGWQDTGLVYVADGYSRTGYVNLSDAEAEIPPLRDCLAALRSNLYDVLICYNYDRFGDLIIMVANEFRNQKKQLYSVSQPSQIFENYDVYSDDSSYIIQSLAPIWQRQRISDLRRKWNTGMPRRIKDGLTPLSTPFGYRWVGKREIPELVPNEAALILQMRDWLFQGLSMQEITRRCDASGVASPRGNPHWDSTSIRNILSNPYYSGQVILHKTKVVSAPQRKAKVKQIIQPRSLWLTDNGRHKPLWSEEEHRAIVRELEIRRERNLRSALRYPLSGLIHCGECGRKVYRHTHYNASTPTGQSPIFTCNRRGQACLIMEYDAGLRLIANEIQEQCVNTRYELPQSSQPFDFQAALDDLAARRKRVQESAEMGVYSPTEAAEKITALERQAEAITRKVDEAQNQAEARQQFFGQMGNVLDHLAEWIQGDDPAIVNRMLAALVQKIILHPDQRVEVEFR